MVNGGNYSRHQLIRATIPVRNERNLVGVITKKLLPKPLLVIEQK